LQEKIFAKGNEAVAMAAIEAGCRCYFGYPITPQSDIPEYLARELPKSGGVFMQVESEIAAINMVLGASAAGVRAMTSSSGPGISLKQEGISYMAGSELPGVIVDIMRQGARARAGSTHPRPITGRRREEGGTEDTGSLFLPRTLCRRCTTSQCLHSIFRIFTECRPWCLPIPSQAR